MALADTHPKENEINYTYGRGYVWKCILLHFGPGGEAPPLKTALMLEVGLPAFQLPMFGKCDSLTHCPKEICSACLSKESIPAISLGNAKHPLPTRSLRLLRAAVRTSSALWLHHAHPFVAAEQNHPCHAEKERVWSRSCGLQDVLPCSDCALSCAT